MIIYACDVCGDKIGNTLPSVQIRLHDNSETVEVFPNLMIARRPGNYNRIMICQECFSAMLGNYVTRARE